MKVSDPYQFYREEAPEAAAAFDQLISAMAMEGGLDQKTMQLIYIGMKAALGDSNAVYAHVPMAKHCGATKAEIKNTILLTLVVGGVSPVLACLQPALEAYDFC